MVPGPGQIPSNATWKTLANGSTVFPGLVIEGGPGSPSAPFANTAARNAAYASVLPGYAGFPAYVSQGAGLPPLLTTWGGGTNTNWNPVGTNAAPVSFAKKYSLMVAGDSIGLNFKSFGGWLAFLSGGRLAMASNISVAGKRADEIAVVLATTDLTDTGYVYTQLLTNDVAQSTPWATSKAALSNILGICNANGVKLIVGGIPPAAAYVSASQIANARLQAWANSVGVPFCDAWRNIRDSNAEPVSGALSDGIHPVESEYPIAGENAWDDLSAKYLAYLPSPVDPSLYMAGQYANILVNAGATVDIGPANGEADGWSVTGATPTLEARESYLGNYQKAVATGTGAATILSSTANITPGSIVASADIVFTPVTSAKAQAWDTFNGKTYLSAWIDHDIEKEYSGKLIAFQTYGGTAYVAGMTAIVSGETGAAVKLGAPVIARMDVIQI
jgi:hypothetical protein